MVHIDDLVEPRLEKIALPDLASLSRPHGITSASPETKRITTKPAGQFARKSTHKPPNPANTNTCRRQNSPFNQWLGYSSRATYKFSQVNANTRMVTFEEDAIVYNQQHMA
jgi:hypothetical protein